VADNTVFAGARRLASTLVGNGGRNWFFAINISNIVDFHAATDFWTPYWWGAYVWF